MLCPLQEFFSSSFYRPGPFNFICFKPILHFFAFVSWLTQILVYARGIKQVSSLCLSSREVDAGSYVDRPKIAKKRHQNLRYCVSHFTANQTFTCDLIHCFTPTGSVQKTMFGNTCVEVMVLLSVVNK